MSLDPKTQMLYEVLGSAGLGTNIGNLPHIGNVLAATNYGVGGKRRIGCLEYEYFPTKNDPGIPPKDLSTLGEIYYAFPGGNGQYCPNTYGATPYPCPAFPCYNGPAAVTSNHGVSGGAPNHDEFSVQRGQAGDNDTSSSAAVVDANTPSLSNNTAKRVRL